MANGYDDEYDDEAGPYQRTLIETVRRHPALAAPTQGAPKRTRQLAFEKMQEVERLAGQRPDMGERERVAQAQIQGAGQDIGPALLLQTLGGRMAPLGGQILQRSLAARAPQKVQGGELIGGRFVEDPYTAQERQLKAAEFGARNLQTLAGQESEEERYAARLAETKQAREDADRRHREQLGETRAARADTRTLARERFEYEKGKEKYTLVQDKETGQPIGRWNQATGVLEPLGSGPTPAGGPVAPKLNEIQSRAFDAATKIGTGMKVIGTMSTPPGMTAITALTTSHPQKRALLNKAMNAEDQAYVNAAGNILAGILRKESGAAITAQEWSTYGPQYLPWWGDDPKTVADKLQVLNSTYESYVNQSGQSGAKTLRAGNAPSGRELPEGSVPDVMGAGEQKMLPRSTAPKGPGSSAADYKRRVGL